MYKEPLPPQDRYSIVPNSGLQFLDFAFDAQRLEKLVTAYGQQLDAKGTRTLQTVAPNPEGELCVVGSDEVVDQETVFTVKFTQALAALQEQWLPAPFFRQKGRDANGEMMYEGGPSNWVRMRVVPLASADDEGNTHRSVFLIDTSVLEADAADGYVAPLLSDAQNEALTFGFAASLRDSSWFLAEEWVSDWLQQALSTATARQDTASTSDRLSMPHLQTGEVPETAFWAFYLTLLTGLESVIGAPCVRFVDTLTSGSARSEHAIDVVLALDVGNSRTCGILIENPEHQGLNLRDSTPLELRDLTRVEQVHTDPFASLVEFREAYFGDALLSMASGRSTGFHWPSLVRIGPEAQRLQGHRFGSEGSTGLSAPKRYLWDESPSRQAWLFNSGEHDENLGEERPVSGEMLSWLNETGDFVDGGNSGTIEAKFSRASLFTLMLFEITSQALMQINSVAHRVQSQDQNVARRLSRVILTIPSGTPLSERRLFEKRVADAGELVRSLLGGGTPDDDTVPEFVVQLDEASCTQILYIYAEIAQRLGRRPSNVAAVLGLHHPGAVRIASLDIGGGTTDLAITTFEVAEHGSVSPTLNFSEGFRRAGDDILEAVIVNHVLRAIDDHLVAAHDVPANANTLGRWLVDSEETAPKRQRKKMFVTRVLAPIGIAVLQQHESQGLHRDYAKLRDEPIKVSLEDVTEVLDETMIEYLDEIMASYGADGFSLDQVVVTTSGRSLEATVATEMDGIVSALSRVVHALQCDVLLLSGRPSRLPAITELVNRKLPMSPHRIIPMHRFRIGDWFRFASPRGVVEDPKTTVVVGSLIGALASRSVLQNFHLKMGTEGNRSVARILGRMDDEVIPADYVLFDDIESPEETESRELVWSNTTFIGFRQVKSDRWPATPLYLLSLGDDVTEQQLKRLPWRVTFARQVPDVSGTAMFGTPPNSESLRIQKIESIGETGDVGPVPNAALRLTLQTMRQADGYWLDTGKIRYERERVSSE